MALTKVAPAGIGSTPGDGYRIGSSFLHSTGVELTNANASGIVTAAQFDGKLNIGIATFTDDVKFTGATSGRDVLWDKSADELKFTDNSKISFGTDRDLQLSHNNNDSIISHIGSATGNLKILSGGAQSIECVKAGAVTIAHNGTTKLATSSTGVTVTGQLDVGNVNSTGVITATKFVGDIAVGSSITYGDNEKAYFGTGLDLKIYHNTVANTTSPANHLYANSNYIDSHGAGNLFIRTAGTVGTYIGNTDGEHAASFHANGSAVLYWDANEKFRTTTSGIDVTGQAYVDSIHCVGELDVTGHIDLNSDSHRIKIGAGDDFQLYHNGSNNFIETNVGDIRIKTSAGSGNLTFTAGGNTERLRITAAGNVGINDNNPANHLIVKAPGGSGHATAKVVSGDASTTMVMQAIQGSEGRLGIESNHPLAIYAGTTERLRITSAGDILIGNTNGGAEAINMVGGGGGILISRLSSGSPSNGQTLADIGFNSYSSTQTCSTADALIRGQAAGNHSGSSAPSDLLFFTKPSSTGPGSAPTERLRIMSDGRVGIKFTGNYTMNPNSTDLVIGDGGSGRGITLWTASGADNQTISFQTNESLSRAEGEISYGPTGTSVTNDRNAMMFRTNSGERMRITSAGRIGVNNTEPSGRTGSIDISSNDGSSGRTFTDQRHNSMLTLRNPSTTHHAYTQLAFINGGGNQSATLLRHSKGGAKSNNNYEGDLRLFRRVGGNGGANNDFRESVTWCGLNEGSRQIWWAQGAGDTSNTERLGWHHLSGQQDTGDNQYMYFRAEIGAASYSRPGMGKYTVVWTTGHASGYGYQMGYFGWYNHHGNSRIYVNDHIVQRNRASNGSYYGWSNWPTMEIMNYTQSGGTNAGIVFRCEGNRSGGYDMGIRLGFFLDLYVPESSNGDSTPRLYNAGSSHSNLDGTVARDFVTFQSTNPNQTGQP